jgi:cytochrome c oxidase assembly protein subunit 15
MKSEKFTSIWLLTVSGTILLMVMVGGITRLTRSGLSIVEWRPITGIVPPLNEVEWQQEFDKYRRFPEYQKMNAGMSLPEFKNIFFWEYFHRLIGRLIGIIFLVPLLYLLFTKRLQKPMIRKTLLLLLFGGLQGFMGWYMVKSGLVDMPRVSHYRLAAHLILAFFIMEYIMWILLDERKIENNRPTPIHSRLKSWSLLLLVLIVIQILYGAFTAGLRAGYGYNTFPKMGAHWVPENMFLFEPWIINFIDNNVTVQFIHRMLGWTVFIATAGLLWFGLKNGVVGEQKRALHSLAGSAFLQFLLGVVTLLTNVSLHPAVLHQLGGVLLLTASVYAYHTFLRAK